MKLKAYLRIPGRRWMTIVVVTLLAIGATALFTLSVTPQYASTARLFISTPGSSSEEAYKGGQFSQARVTSYADLMTGEEISRRVAERLHLSDSPRDLADQVEAEAKPGTVVLSITVTDPSAERAHLLTQAFSEELVRHVRELETPDGQKTAPVKASFIDRASTPNVPVFPRPVRYLTLATLLGLLIGTGLAVIREMLDTSISTPQDLAEVTADAPLLGSIAFDRDALARPLVTDLTSHAPRVESFRVLATNLLFIDVGSESRAFVITSSVPDEGKSTTVCNLALTLARAGEKVVVVEADLRRPTVATYLNLEGAVGVTTILAGRVGIEEALQSAPWGLKVIAAGSIPPNPAELLQSAAMKSLIQELRSRFDIVLLDAPPLLPVIDAAILAAESDGAILVTRHGTTTRDQVAAAAGRLDSVDARLASTVITWMPARNSPDGYGDAYGYAPEAGRSKSIAHPQKAATSTSVRPKGPTDIPDQPTRKELRQRRKEQVRAAPPAPVERPVEAERPPSPGKREQRKQEKQLKKQQLATLKEQRRAARISSNRPDPFGGPSGISAPARHHPTETEPRDQPSEAGAASSVQPQPSERRPRRTKTDPVKPEPVPDVESSPAPPGTDSPVNARKERRERRGRNR